MQKYSRTVCAEKSCTFRKRYRRPWKHLSRLPFVQRSRSGRRRRESFATRAMRRNISFCTFARVQKMLRIDWTNRLFARSSSEAITLKEYFSKSRETWSFSTFAKSSRQRAFHVRWKRESHWCSVDYCYRYRYPTFHFTTAVFSVTSLRYLSPHQSSKWLFLLRVTFVRRPPSISMGTSSFNSSDYNPTSD